MITMRNTGYRESEEEIRANITGELGFRLPDFNLGRVAMAAALTAGLAIGWVAGHDKETDHNPIHDIPTVTHPIEESPAYQLVMTGPTTTIR